MMPVWRSRVFGDVHRHLRWQMGAGGETRKKVCINCMHFTLQQIGREWNCYLQTTDNKDVENLEPNVTWRQVSATQSPTGGTPASLNLLRDGVSGVRWVDMMGHLRCLENTSCLCWLDAQDRWSGIRRAECKVELHWCQVDSALRCTSCICPDSGPPSG